MSAVKWLDSHKHVFECIIFTTTDDINPATNIFFCMVCTQTPIRCLQVRKAYDMDEDDETGRENFRIKANLLFVICDRLGFQN